MILFDSMRRKLEDLLMFTPDFAMGEPFLKFSKCQLTIYYGSGVLFSTGDREMFKTQFLHSRNS